MCILNNKLYVRDSKIEETPVRIFCPKTLQFDKEATDAINWSEAEEKNELTLKFMKEDDETGRRLNQSPFFTDGTYLYVISLKKPIKPEIVEEDAPVVPTIFVLEKFCPQTWRHLKSTPLFKNDHLDTFTDEEGCQITTWHTNGKYLMICFVGKRLLFDLENGIRIDKQKSPEFSAFVFHDHQTNTFYSIEKDAEVYYLTDFTIEAMKIPKKVSSESTSFATPIEKIRDQYLQDHVSAPTVNVIKRKMIK
jgi:hypothetical protein